MPDAPHTNRLAAASSPYLLQHAHNPVDWWPWGAPALAEARRRGVPILLSVGYATCYWCHVMERESFEHEATAAVMNKHFLCIKLDREQRPDLDDLYMTATQLLTGQGGWPMNCFLTPPGARGDDDRGMEPFYCGTYFPPTPAHGRPSWTQLLQGIADAWANRRDEILAQAAQVTDALKATLERPATPEPLNDTPIRDAVDHLLRTHDRQHGGFGGAPKFPTPTNLQLLHFATNAGRRADACRNALHLTLDRMARGGVFDQVGGGFHRYSVDAHWLIPHFEKMLYDNAQLLTVYAAAAGDATIDPTRRARYHRVLRETADWALREMRDATGAFWSAQDAEVNGREGGNYVWTADEARAAIIAGGGDEALAAFATRLYGLDLGTNFQDPHHPDADPANVLWLPQPLDELGELADVQAQRDRVNALLKAVRDQREQPTTDDKVIAAWNGMMIVGLVDAAIELSEQRYLDAAHDAAMALRDHLRRGDGTLCRTMRRGVAEGDGLLEDYAWFALGLLALDAATPGGPAWYRDHAAELIDTATQRFDATATRVGGLFDAPADAPDLLVALQSTYDGATPSPNATMLHARLRLAEATGDAIPLDRAAADLRAFMHRLTRESAGMTTMVTALGQTLRQQEDHNDPPEHPAEPGPVTATLSPLNQTDAGWSSTVTLSAADGWHLNASDPGVDGLIGLTITAVDAAGEPIPVAIDWPAPATLAGTFGDVNVYAGTVTLPVRATARDAPAPAEVLVHYQACSDTACARPSTARLRPSATE